MIDAVCANVSIRVTMLNAMSLCDVCRRRNLVPCSCPHQFWVVVQLQLLRLSNMVYTAKSKEQENDTQFELSNDKYICT